MICLVIEPARHNLFLAFAGKAFNKIRVWPFKVFRAGIYRFCGTFTLSLSLPTNVYLIICFIYLPGICYCWPNESVFSFSFSKSNTIIEMDYRLLVVSSRARNKVAIFNSVLSHNLILVDYNYESTTLDDLLEKIKRALNGTKVASMALVLHTSERELFICSPGSALISLKTLINDDGIKRFCVEIAQNVIDQVNTYT